MVLVTVKSAVAVDSLRSKVSEIFFFPASSVVEYVRVMSCVAHRDSCKKFSVMFSVEAMLAVTIIGMSLSPT